MHKNMQTIFGLQKKYQSELTDVQTPHRGRGEWLKPSLPLLCSSFFFSCKILPKYKSTTTITMMRAQLLSAREKYNTQSHGGTEGENTTKNPLSQTI